MHFVFMQGRFGIKANLFPQTMRDLLHCRLRKKVRCSLPKPCQQQSQSSGPAGFHFFLLLSYMESHLSSCIFSSLISFQIMIDKSVNLRLFLWTYFVLTLISKLSDQLHLIQVAASVLVFL